MTADKNVTKVVGRSVISVGAMEKFCALYAVGTAGTADDVL